MRSFRLIASVACLALSATAFAQTQPAAPPADPVSPYPNRGWTEHFAVLKDGTKLHYVEMGKGTPVILIHGAGGSAIGNWFVNGIAPALAKTNRVIGIDMRGHGLTEAAGEGRGDMAGDVLEFMEQQKITKAHIGGFSMGGGVTGTLLRRKPEIFLSAHFGGSGLTETAEWRDKVPADKTGTAPDDVKAREAYAARPAARGAAVGNNAAAAAGGAARGARGAAAGGARGRGAAAGGAAAAAGAGDTLDLSKIDIPFLVVNGEYDRPNAKSHRLWREGKTLTNVVLKDKGHLSAVMEGFIPQIYIDSMVAFITANNPKQ